jgi:hypothetical protein
LCFSNAARERLGVRGVQSTISRTGLPMVVPATLSPQDARRFFVDHLGRYDTYVQQYPRASEPGLVERIVRQLGEQVAQRPRAGTESDYDFDLRGEVPVLPSRAATVPGWLRADTSS